MRPYEDIHQPGKVDVKGVEWWACDPYPTWFRWDVQAGGERRLRVKRDGVAFVGEKKPRGCGPQCRLTSWSNHCECQGWCL